ncbi:MAG: hypothetical protein CVU11_02275 [Bacteroidetes bacterium HGW-Bacteroidetes-6]|jgi:hypothetical protein|nr:MAG: hypothetical protein CVU11_02275 [Bacteroidetes bacterium HGW-Bacteroidetes-6]
MVHPAIAILFSFFSIQAMTQTSKNSPAMEYDLFIQNQAERIDKAVDTFNNAIALYDGDSILKTYDYLLKITEDVIERTEKKQKVNGCEEYREATLNLFRFYLRTFETDYHETVAIMYRETITDADIEEMEKIFDRVELKESLYLDAYYHEMDAFCIKNGIELE